MLLLFTLFPMDLETSSSFKFLDLIRPYSPDFQEKQKLRVTYLLAMANSPS